MILMTAITISACGSSESMSSNADTGTSAEPDAPVVINPVDPIYKPQSLLWEGQHPEAVLWSAILYRVMGSPDVRTLLEGADDVEDFCPSYDKLNEMERVNFWAFLISSIAKYESGFNPLKRHTDDDGESDDVTGKTKIREGLLQLSYSLKKLYKFCDFDWDKDKKKNDFDPTRTILNPVTNLNCGAKILANQIQSKGQIAHNGSFWQTLRKNGRFSAVTEIKALTLQLPFCSAK